MVMNGGWFIIYCYTNMIANWWVAPEEAAVVEMMRTTPWGKLESPSNHPSDFPSPWQTGCIGEINEIPNHPKLTELDLWTWSGFESIDLIWVNYSNSLTWIEAIKGDDVPKINPYSPWNPLQFTAAYDQPRATTCVHWRRPKSSRRSSLKNAVGGAGHIHYHLVYDNRKYQIWYHRAS